MEAMLAILFVMAMGAVVVVGSLAIDVTCRARIDDRDREA